MKMMQIFRRIDIVYYCKYTSYLRTFVLLKGPSFLYYFTLIDNTKRREVKIFLNRNKMSMLIKVFC